MPLPLALAALALLPFAVRGLLAIVWMAVGPPPIHLDGDDALIELAAIEAAAGERWLGAYSRFGWFHPGPLLFYALVPLYELSGRHAMGVHWGALLINALAAGGLLVASRFSPWVSVGLAMHVAAFGVGRLSHPWGPFVTVLPFGLFVWMCAARRLVWSAGLGSFLVQTHVGYVLPVVALAAAALAGRLVDGLGGSARAAPPKSAPLGLPLALAAGVGASLWLPPVLGAASNLADLARFFLEPAEGQPLAESATLVASMLGASGAFVLGGLAHPELAWIGGLVAVAELVLVALAWRRGDRLAGLVLLGAVAAVLAAARVRGELHWYLLLWASALGMLGWAAVGRTLLAGRRWGVALAALIALATTAASLQQIAAEPFPEPTDASRRIAELAAAAPPGRILVSIEGEDDWRLAAGVVLALRKAGREVAVEGYGAGAFGPRFVPRGDESAFRLGL